MALCSFVFVFPFLKNVHNFLSFYSTIRETNGVNGIIPASWHSASEWGVIESGGDCGKWRVCTLYNGQRHRPFLQQALAPSTSRLLASENEASAGVAPEVFSKGQIQIFYRFS